MIKELLLALIPPFDHGDPKMRNWQFTVAGFIYALVGFCVWSYGVFAPNFGDGYAFAGEVNKKFQTQETKLSSFDISIKNVQKDLISAKIHDKEIERCRILAAPNNQLSDELRQSAVDTLNGFLNDKAEEYRKLTGATYSFQLCQLLLISAGGK